MRENSILNPNYSENEVWDLLSEYLEKKHLANTSTIQRGIYADNNRDGSIVLVEEQEDDHATLYCYRNFNFNISGSIVFQLDTSLNDEFDLESICQYLHKPFPNPQSNPLSLTDEQIEERKENIRLLKIKQSNEDQQSYNKSRVKNITLSMLYTLEYHRGQSQNNRIFHYSQITRSVEDSRFIKSQQIKHHSDGVVISCTPPTAEEYLSFIKDNKELIRSFNADFNEVFELAADTTATLIDQIISDEMRKLGCIIFPLKNIDGLVVSAMIINDVSAEKNESALLKYEIFTNSSLQLPCDSEESPNIIFLTTSFSLADSIKIAIPSACVYATLSQENMIQTILEIQNKRPDTILLIVTDNEYTRVMQKSSVKNFISSDFCRISQHLADNLKISKNIGVIFPPAETDPEAISFTDILHEHGEEHLKEQLDHAITELVERRDSNTLELNHLLQVHADAHERIRAATSIIMPSLIVLDQDESAVPSISTNVPLLNNKTNNTVLFQESRRDFRNWINKAQPNQDNETEQKTAEAMCRFVKESFPIDPAEVQEILHSKRLNQEEDIF